MAFAGYVLSDDFISGSHLALKESVCACPGPCRYIMTKVLPQYYAYHGLAHAIETCEAKI